MRSLSLLFLILGCCFVWGQQIGQNLGFDQNSCSYQSCYVPRDVVLPGWTVSSFWNDVVSISTNDFYGCINPNGWALNFGWYTSSISQNLVTKIGTRYNMSFKTLASEWTSDTTLMVTAGSQVFPVELLRNANPSICGDVIWETHTITFTATQNNTLLQFEYGSTMLLDTIDITEVVSCDSDADCKNQGTCTNSQNNANETRFCSCFPGYSSLFCSDAPTTECQSQISPVTPLSMGFQSSASVEYLYPNLTIAFQTNLEEGGHIAGTSQSNTPPYVLRTVAFFGADRTSFPGCGYPTQYWHKSLTANCFDEYTFVTSWAQARDVCGFTLIPGTKTYTQSLTIERYYLMNERGTERVERHIRNLTVEFPDEIRVRDQPTVLSGIPNFDAIVTQLEFNPSTDLWTAVVSTTLQSPYFIQNYTVSNITGEISSDNRFQNSVLSTSAGCSAGSPTCYQQLTFQFARGLTPDACTGLSGSISANLVLACDNSVPTGSCTSLPGASITLPFNTANSCPGASKINVTGYLVASEDSAITKPKTQFHFDEVAYYGIHVESQQGGLSSVQIKEGTVCFRNPNGTCTYPAYTVLPASGNYQIVFSVAFASPENAGLFNPLGSVGYDVEVTVSVNFTYAKRGKSSAVQNGAVDLKMETTVQPTSTHSSSSTLSSGWIVVAFLCLFSML